MCDVLESKEETISDKAPKRCMYCHPGTTRRKTTILGEKRCAAKYTPRLQDDKRNSNVVLPGPDQCYITAEPPSLA